MHRQPLRLTEQLLAAYRPGSLVAVAMGSAAGIPHRRPRGHAIVARAQVADGGSRGALPPPAPGTAIVAIRGVIEQRANPWSCGETCGYDTIEADICGALCDPGVGSLVLDVDSPGGDVPGLEEATARIRAVADEIGKPILGYINEFAASAALYLLVGICDAIYLPPSGRFGSISSAVLFATEARRLEKEGTDVYVARGLPGKMNPNSLEKLDDLGRARLDSLALECSERFVEFVALSRGIDAETIRSWNAGIFTGATAVEAGLADGIGTLDQTIALAGELAAGAQEAA